jgi:hypothetical protein
MAKGNDAAADIIQDDGTGTWKVKGGLAQMLKGGVIMDVVNAEQARVAEEAGAVAVMALERVPADIRRDGGVARMSDPKMIKEVKGAVTIPVMGKVRIGHFVEAQILQELGARRRETRCNVRFARALCPRSSLTRARFRRAIRRRRLHRRVRGAHDGRRREPREQEQVRGAVRVRRAQPRRGAPPHR